MIKRFTLYGLIGIFLEIFWTGFNSFLNGDLTFQGHSSLIMFPIYGSVIFLEKAFIQLKNAPLFLRGLVYMCLIFSAEYFSGILLNKLNMCPWSYANAYFNINNVIRIDYSPLWFCAGLFYELLYKKITSNHNKNI